MNDHNPYQPPESPLVSDEQTRQVRISAARKVRAGRGAAWFGDGLALVTGAFSGWLLSFLVFVALYLLITLPSMLTNLINPIAGSVFGSVVTIPMVILVGGMMAACHQTPFAFANVISAVRKRAGSLAILGVLYMVLSLVILVLLMLSAFFFFDLNMFATNESEIVTFEALQSIGVIVLLSIVLSTPLLMSMWFAPALVTIGYRSPLRAMIDSFRACLKNLLALIVFVLVGIVVGVAVLLLALIVIGIFTGIISMLTNSGSLGLLIFIPIGLLYLVFFFLGFSLLFSSQYISFRDVFIATD